MDFGITINRLSIGQCELIISTPQDGMVMNAMLTDVEMLRIARMLIDGVTGDNLVNLLIDPNQ